MKAEPDKPVLLKRRLRQDASGRPPSQHLDCGISRRDLAQTRYFNASEAIHQQRVAWGKRLQSSNLTRVRLLTHAFVVSIIVVVLLLLYIAPMRFSPKGTLPVFASIASIAALSIYCTLRGMKAFAIALECIGLALALVIPCLIATYLAASFDLPLADDRLARLDAALGFDWLAYLRFINAHPTLATTLTYSYRLFSYELLGLLFILPMAEKYERAYMMIAAFAIICLLSSVISIWFPAMGSYVNYGVAANAYPNVDSYYGFQSLKDFVAVRKEANFVLSLDNISGIVVFPSDHAAAAALCIWAAWGVKFFRAPFLVLNVLMTASAVANANHYLIDVLAGLVVAMVSILAVKAAFARLSRPGFDNARNSASGAADLLNSPKAN